jgi:hypothetical protein
MRIPTLPPSLLEALARVPRAPRRDVPARKRAEVSHPAPDQGDEPKFEIVKPGRRYVLRWPPRERVRVEWQKRPDRVALDWPSATAVP